MRIAQYGTGHGHAAGKLLALQHNPVVELAGVYEPDQQRRAMLEQSGAPYAGVHWFAAADEMLDDPSIVAVASEGRNDESLDQTEQIIAAGKHVWYDKPAGDNWPQWQRVVARAAEQRLHIQMGYMFRYHAGFQLITSLVQNGTLGAIYAVRAHMSTNISLEARQVIARHSGGIYYDLAGHMLDQIVWLLGRPERVTPFLRDDSRAVPGFKDNTLVVMEYPRALATVDIAAMETTPIVRRFEVYGDRGSASLEMIWPLEPTGALRLCLAEAHSGYQRGEQFVPLHEQSRQQLYELELEAFLEVLSGTRPPERPSSHDLLVQETLLRATSGMKDEA